MSAAPPPPIAWHVARWGAEPFSGGSWSPLAPGGTPAHRALLGSPIDGRFVLAGEATNPAAPSMTHGAHDEGVRAARWALDEAGARRVVVIGAGFAGLAAARTIHDAGAQVVVVEARDRIGGRAHTVPLGDGIVADAGAAWLQQYPTNSLARLAEQLGLRTVATDFHAPLAAAPDGPVGDVAAALIALQAAASRAAPGASLADVVPAHLASLSATARRDARHAIHLDLDLENGAPHSRLSAAQVFTDPGVGVGDRWLPGGYLQLLEHLADGLNIRLSTPVHRVEWNGDGVLVDHLGADVCICTIPVWLLPQLSLQPGLPPAHTAALARLSTGLVEKVLLRFDERWWPTDGNGYLRWYDDPPSWGEWLDLTDGVGAPVVAALIAGDAVRQMHDGRSDAAVVAGTAAALHAWAMNVTR